MFLNGGVAHVGGNMLVLWIFGDNVEDARRRPCRWSRSVVVIRTTELDVAEDGDGQAQFSGVGSGVLVTTDGKVLTADHLVHAASEILCGVPGW
jgi:S1-C subfamily serine protease